MKSVLMLVLLSVEVASDTAFHSSVVVSKPGLRMLRDATLTILRQKICVPFQRIPDQPLGPAQHATNFRVSATQLPQLQFAPHRHSNEIHLGLTGLAMQGSAEVPVQDGEETTYKSFRSTSQLAW